MQNDIILRSRAKDRQARKLSLSDIISNPYLKLRTRVVRASTPSGSLGMLGKTVVVTGATSGIGLATAKELARRSAFVIGTGRSAERCRAAESKIKSEIPDAEIAYVARDLSSLEQVRGLADDIRRLIKDSGRNCLDVLINNAGTVSSYYVSTADGYELQFAVNHLAPFLLTNELMPLLKSAPSARVITVSSGSHYRTRIRWNDIFMRKHYNCLMAYKQSKLANVLFTCGLNRRLGSSSTVRAFAADPGLVRTDIGLKGTSGIERWVWSKRCRGGESPDKAAVAIAFLACEPSIQNSEHVYWKDCKPLVPSKYARNATEAAMLWDYSERLCGISDPASEKPVG
jgi:NAD(P)-dependent dehydrogenase (short-subunit alcohol dehydrogenase family)